jgi:hypothetical protein
MSSEHPAAEGGAPTVRAAASAKARPAAAKAPVDEVKSRPASAEAQADAAEPQAAPAEPQADAAEPQAAPAEPQADAAEPQADEVKDKFREALERKRHNQAKRSAEAREPAKIHGEHGPAASRREFRRKSG